MKKMESNRLHYPAPIRPITEEEAAKILAEPKPDLANWKESDKNVVHVLSLIHI